MVPLGRQWFMNDCCRLVGIHYVVNGLLAAFFSRFSLLLVITSGRNKHVITASLVCINSGKVNMPSSGNQFHSQVSAK